MIYIYIILGGLFGTIIVVVPFIIGVLVTRALLNPTSRRR